MLKIKQAIDDCNIKQQLVATMTGWSKAQISITFNDSVFPKDADRFKASMRAFVEVTEPIQDWLVERGLTIEALFTPLSEANSQG